MPPRAVIDIQIRCSVICRSLKVKRVLSQVVQFNEIIFIYMHRVVHMQVFFVVKQQKEELFAQGGVLEFSSI